MFRIDKICHLILAGPGEPKRELIEEGDFVIAVDAGVAKCEKTKITPNLAVGDFDSLGRVPEAYPVKKLDCVKDDTDSFAAVDSGFEENCNVFYLHCALGGRFSHSLGNIAALLSIKNRGGKGYLLGENEFAFIIDGAADFSPGGYLSLFPIGESAKVEIAGCKYSGIFVLDPDSSLGVSNEPYAGARVSVISGTVLAVVEA